MKKKKKRKIGPPIWPSPLSFLTLECVLSNYANLPSLLPIDPPPPPSSLTGADDKSAAKSDSPPGKPGCLRHACCTVLVEECVEECRQLH